MDEFTADAIQAVAKTSKELANEVKDLQLRITQLERPQSRLSPKAVPHLQWMYDRMVAIHGENKNYDYMIEFKRIIDSL